MLSRVADSIYWMSRNLERTENLARFIEVTRDFVLDVPTAAQRQWEPLVYVTGEQERFFSDYQIADSQSVMEFLVLSQDYPNSMTQLIRMARENARSVRETISSEMWESLNNLYQWFQQETRAGQPWRSPSDFFRSIMQQCMQLNGLTDSTMTRDHGWHFANLGRQLERADQISRLLDVKYYTLLPTPNDVNTPIDYLQWSSLLRSVSGFEMYRKLHHDVTIHNVVDFMVLNRRFPRAVNHCLAEANRSLHSITGCPLGEFSISAEQTLGKVCAELAFTSVQAIVDHGLHEFVDALQSKINQVGDEIFEAFFALEPLEDEHKPGLGSEAIDPTTTGQSQG